MQKIRLFVNPVSAREKFIELPVDWEDMNEDEQKEYCDEEALAYLARVAKYGGEVVDQ